MLVDGNSGGLVLGPSLKKGGIQLIYVNRDAQLHMIDKMEGWQFIINAWADADNRDEINSISPTSLIGDSFFRPYRVPLGTEVITVTPKEVNGVLVTPYLLLGTNFVAVTRKEVVKKNLRRLTEMNRIAWQKHFVDA